MAGESGSAKTLPFAVKEESYSPPRDEYRAWPPPVIWTSSDIAPRAHFNSRATPFGHAPARVKAVSIILEACPGYAWLMSLIPWPVHRRGKFRRKITIVYDDKEIRRS